MPPPPKESLYVVTLRNFQRTFLRGALALEHGHQLRTAQSLGIHRNTLCRLLDELGIDPTAYKERR